ncbi:MAG: homoserine kinase [Chloroherpetonaceae bacterium]|nr:homoserine kinase [Chloroherpetonaceae bacterium]MDW8018638.1 homoserine kinase [Chloroherpetonaceae bacterium]
MHEDAIAAFAPATVANVGAGFDILGFALHQPGDIVVARFNQVGTVRITQLTGNSSKLPREASLNTAGVAVIKLLEHLSIRQGIDLELHKRMPLGSGLGSSAASAVAAVVAANALLGSPLKKIDLLPFAMEGERVACGAAHADNAAPSLLGGFVLIRSYAPLDVVELNTPERLYAVVVHPHIEVKTQDARDILKKTLLLKDAIVQWGNIAGLVAGLMKSDYALIGRSLSDVIVEPVRAILIPGFSDVKAAALRAGALGCSISGSGPSVFALVCDARIAETVAQAMQDAFAEQGISSDRYISKINQEGAYVLPYSQYAAL